MTFSEAKIANDAARSAWPVAWAHDTARTFVAVDLLDRYAEALGLSRIVVDPAATGIRIGYPCSFCRTLTDANPTCRTCGAPRTE